MSGTNLTLTTSDRVSIRYDDESQGRPVVLLCGFTDQSPTWVYQRDALVELVPGPASDRFLAPEIDAAVEFVRSGQVRRSAQQRIACDW